MKSVAARKLDSMICSLGSGLGKKLLVAVVGGSLLTAAFDSGVNRSTISSGMLETSAYSERIVPPTAPCSDLGSRSQFNVSTQPVKMATVGLASTIKLDAVAKRLVSAMNSAAGFGQAVHHGVTITGKRLTVAAESARDAYTIDLMYPSDFVNVESWGPLRPMQKFTAQTSGSWFLTVSRSAVGEFGESGTLAVGEVYYDPHTVGSPIICLTGVELIPGSQDARLVGYAVEDPKVSFLMIQAGSTRRCTTFGRLTNGKYPGYNCPARERMTTELKGSASHTVTVKNKQGRRVSKTNRITVTASFRESSGYLYCKTKAICTQLGANLGENTYAQYSEYESTLNRYWLDPKVELSVQHKIAWNKTLDRAQLSWNAPLPWCVALAAFLSCSLDLDLGVGIEMALNSEGMLIVWADRPYAMARARKWTIASTGASEAPAPDISLRLLEPFSTPQASGGVGVELKAPIITLSVGLRIATISELIWAEAGLDGSIWNQVSVSSSSDTYIGSCGSLDAVAEAGARIPIADIEVIEQLSVPLLEACTD